MPWHGRTGKPRAYPFWNWEASGGQERDGLRKTDSGSLAYLLSQDLLEQGEKSTRNPQVTEWNLEPKTGSPLLWTDEGEVSLRSSENNSLQLSTASTMAQGHGKWVTDKPKAGLLDVLSLHVTSWSRTRPRPSKKRTQPCLESHQLSGILDYFSKALVILDLKIRKNGQVSRLPWVL